MKLKTLITSKHFTWIYTNLIIAFFSMTVLIQSVWGLEVAHVIAEAKKGDKNAAYFLGVMYRTGSGVSQDCDKAFKWTEQSALQGHPLAQSHLGMIYKKGCGKNVAQNLVEAYFWTALAAKQELQFARENLKELEDQLHPYLVEETQEKVKRFKPVK